jgi:hypothetical protein
MRRRCVRYSPRLAALICARIANGMTMRGIELVNGMPSVTSMRKWLRTHEEFARMYEAACEQRDFDDMRARLLDASIAGRRTRYSTEIAEKICRRVEAGWSVRELSNARDLPACSTIYNWLGRYEDFRRMFASACELRADRLADEVMEIADAPSGLTPPKGEAPSREVLHWARLQIEARKWRASRLAPLKYGMKNLGADAPEPMSHEDALLELE